MSKIINFKEVYIYYTKKVYLKILFSLIITLLITYLSLADLKREEILEKNIPFADKIVHFFMYFFYGLVLYINNKTSKRSTKNYIITLYAIFFGFLMEFLQWTVFTYRSGDFTDMVFNALGIFTAYILFRHWKFLQVQNSF